MYTFSSKVALLAFLTHSLAQEQPTPIVTIAPLPSLPISVNLDPLASALPGLISSNLPGAISDLGAIISEFVPTARVSDLPAILSSELPYVESAIDGYITRVIPPGAIPTSVEAQIVSDINSIVEVGFSELPGLVSQILPPTASLGLIPAVLSSEIPAIDSAVPALVSEYLPEVSSLLYGGGAVATGSVTVPPSTLATATAIPGAGTGGTTVPTATSVSGTVGPTIEPASAGSSLRGCGKGLFAMVAIVGAVVAL